MSFDAWIALHPQDGTCDKCNKPLTEEAPGIYLQSRTRTDGQQTIVIHTKCLEKAISKARQSKEQVA